MSALPAKPQIHFKILNRKDGLPVKSHLCRREDRQAGRTDDQLKGFRNRKGEFLQIEPDDIKALKLTSDHAGSVSLSINEIDTRYLEKPYYLIPADRVAVEAYGVIRDAMKSKGVAARSCIVLYQRGREVVIQPYGKVHVDDRAAKPQRDGFQRVCLRWLDEGKIRVLNC